MVKPAVIEGKWDLSRMEKGVESRYTLVTDRSERHIHCPTAQACFIEPVLKGIEYPLPPEIVKICKGFPVLDIGAHVGSANVYFDEVLQPPKIISCEPHPVCLEYLKSNVNGKTEIVPKAVTDHSGAATLFVSNLMDRDTCEEISYPAYNAASIYDVREKNIEEIPVETVRACDIFDMVGGEEIGLLKIDAEFCEASILMDAEFYLGQVRVVVLEYHSDTQRRQCDALLRWFQPYFTAGHYRQGVAGYVNARVCPPDQYF